jgi:hypothetical protein
MPRRLTRILAVVAAASVGIVTTAVSSAAVDGDVPPPGTATLDPAQVEAGGIVTISGDECHDGVVLFDVVPEGGTLQDLVHAAEVLTAADGTWSYDLDTTGFDVGTYDVSPMECIEPEDDNNRDVYNYDPLAFEVVAAAPPATTAPPTTAPPTTAPPATSPPTTAPPPPAPVPAVAAPSYTG